MPNTTKQFLNSNFDQLLWKKLFKQNTQEYIRKKLKFVQNLWEEKDRKKLSQELKLSYKTTGTWLKIYLKKGLLGLVEKKSSHSKQRLSPSQKQELKEILLTKTPQDYGFDRYIWTGEIISKMIKTEFDIDLKDKV